MPPRLRRALRCIAAWLALVVLQLMAGQLAFAQPSLVRCEPGALAPGKTIELTLHGTKLDEPLRVWSSFPAQFEVLPGDPSQKGRATVQVKATLDASVPIGVGGIAVATAEGPSDILLVTIDDLPSLAEATNNHDLTSAQDVALPCGIDGTADGTVFDYFKLTGRAGQAISLDVLGVRLGSDFDPVLRLLDATGRELAAIDDDEALGADCRLRYTFPVDGIYVIELRDNRFKAGGKYRLRIGDYPLVSASFPLGAAAGVPAGPRTLLAAELPSVLEVSGADKPEEPTAIPLPCAISGKFDLANDRDEYRFTAAKETRVGFRAWTRTLDSPAIVHMRVVNAAGAPLAESPVNENDEPSLTFVSPADGEYRLVVEDLIGRGGEELAYRVEARSGPTFTLRLKNDPKQPSRLSTPLAAGGARDLTVECVRDGYDGPITLAVDSPRSGWQAFNAIIPAKVNEVRVFLLAPADLQPGEFIPLRITGTADVGGAQQSAVMATTAQLRLARPQMPYPPLWLDGLLWAGGAAAKPDFYKIAASRPDVNFPRLIGQTQLTLTFNRNDEKYKDQPLTVLPLGLPAGMTAEVKRNGNGPQETYDIVLQGPKDLPEGRLGFRYLTYGEFAGTGLAFVSDEIPVNIVTPLAVALAPVGPIAPAQTQKVKVVVVRQGDDKQPVEVKFKKLPTGVTGPASVVLAAEQNEVEVELAAAADAPLGKFEELAVTATTKYVGQDLAVDSPNVSLEVKAP